MAITCTSPAGQAITVIQALIYGVCGCVAHSTVDTAKQPLLSSSSSSSVAPQALLPASLNFLRSRFFWEALSLLSSDSTGAAGALTTALLASSRAS